MNPADELRAAAEKLRSLTTDATEGPWYSHDPNMFWGDDHDHRIIGGGKIVATFSNDHNGPLNADYAAAMHPGVGIALAAWLEDAAERIDEQPFPTTYPAATAVARLILGGVP